MSEISPPQVPTPSESYSSSEGLEKLFTALSKAQGEMKPAVMDCRNPHYNSQYASLTSVQDAYREPFARHGLLITQMVFSKDNRYSIRTVLGHSSGQWMSNVFTLLLDKQNMQGLGSAVTYARRYGISSLIGVVDTEDDDGNAAVDRPVKSQETTPAPQGKVVSPKTGEAPKAFIQMPGKVSLAQIQQLTHMTDEYSWGTDRVRAYLKTYFNVDSMKDMTQEQFKNITTAIKDGFMESGDAGL